MNDVVVNGISIRKAADKWNVAITTLSRYVKKQHSRTPNETATVRMVPNYAVKRIYMAGQGKELTEYIIMCSKMFYGLPLEDCKKLGYEMGTINNIKIPNAWTQYQRHSTDTT